MVSLSTGYFATPGKICGANCPNQPLCNAPTAIYCHIFKVCNFPTGQDWIGSVSSYSCSKLLKYLVVDLRHGIHGLQTLQSSCVARLCPYIRLHMGIAWLTRVVCPIWKQYVVVRSILPVGLLYRGRHLDLLKLRCICAGLRRALCGGKAGSCRVTLSAVNESISSA